MKELISISAGDWFLSFFSDFIGTPAILVGLFAMLGSILLRKKITDIILSFFKTAAGFIIIGAGATAVVGSLTNFQVLFSDLFNITGVIPNNDALAGNIFEVAPEIAQLGSIILVVAMVLNIVLAYGSRFKYIFLSGHVLFFMSVMLSGVMVLSGSLDVSKPGDFAIALISSGLILSLYMVLSCAANKRFVKQITGIDDITVAHTGTLSYVMSGWIGELVFKLKKGNKIRSTESVKFPKGLQFFRNTFASMAVTMLIVFMIVYIPSGIMYNTGIKELPIDLVERAAILKIFGPDATVNWFVLAILEAFTFAAGVEVILYGVRLAIGELVPSFKGISDKLVKNAKAGLDIPIIFPYAPNAVLIGFLSSLIAGGVGVGITIGLSQISYLSPLGQALPVVIPGIVAHFFLGAGSGVFGNTKGGILGCVIGSFLNGIIITLVPIVFIAAGWVSKGNLGWGDTDYLLGVIPGLITLIQNELAVKILLILIPGIAFVSLIADGLIKKFVFDKRKEHLLNIDKSQKFKSKNE